MLNQIKEDKWKMATVITAAFVFIVGLVVTISNSSGTYAISASDYSCAYGGGANYVTSLDAYVCAINTVTVPSTSFAQGDSVNRRDTCQSYLTEIGIYESSVYSITMDSGGYGSCSYRALSNSSYCPYGGKPNYVSSVGDLVCNISTVSIASKSFASGTDITISNKCRSYLTEIGIYESSVYDKAMDSDGYGNCSYRAGYVSSSSKCYYCDRTDEFISTYEGTSSLYTCETQNELGWVELNREQSACSATTGVENVCNYCSSTNVYVWAPSDSVLSSCGQGWTTVDKSSSECVTATYIVTYNANGGSGAPSNQGTTINNDLTLSTTKPTRSGHTFLSWNTKPDGSGTTYLPGATYTGRVSVTLYAQWKEEDTPITYTVTYNANGGSGAPSSQTKTENVNLTLSTTKPTRSGYTFLSWNTKPDGSGTTYSSGGTYTANASATLYAQWKENTSVATYTVTYNANGGSGAPSSQMKTENVNLTLSTTKPTRSGYTFLSWNTKSDGTGTTYSSGGTYTANANVTLYAQWDEVSPVTYTVTYNANGGSGAPSSQTKTENVNLTLSTTKPTRSGYTFLSWNTKSDGTGTTYSSGGTYTANASATLYAQWKENTSVATYTVAYNANGGSGAPSSQTKTENVNLTLSTTKPTRSGYTFLSWNTKSDGTGTTYSSGGTYTANASVTLYAIWKEENATTYTVSYDANGGSGEPRSQSGTTITISSTKPTKTGYTFVSWNTEKDGTGTTYTSGSSVTLTTDVMLYAQYKANEYKISYTLNGGTVTGNPTIATYDEVFEIKNPTKTVNVIGNANNTGAVIGENVSVEFIFAGWTSSTIDTRTAYYGDTAWTSTSTKVADTSFKNLTPVNGATVTMVANWTSADVTLPTVIKEGYTCNWNTKADGKGTDYSSGGKYTPDANSASSINLYAICLENSKTDEDLDTNIKTGDALILLVWVIGIGTLGYSVYYFMKKRNNI